MPSKWSFRSLVIFALFTLIIPLALIANEVSGDGDDDPYSIPEKSELKYPNLGSTLDRLVARVETRESSAEEAAKEAPVHQGSAVAVTIQLSGHVDEVVAFLEDNGGDPRNVGEDYIEAYVPVSLLGAVSERPGVIRVREIIPPHAEQISQQVIGNGPAVHGSLPWNQAGYSGQDVKVGVIDVGFRSFSGLRGTELPANVGARCYTDLGVFTANLADCDRGESDHGTIVAESLLDIAPAVSLYIANPISDADLQATADWMASQGVTVINHSVSHVFEGPGDGNSYLSVSPLNTVDRAVANGIVWVNSAGNHAERTWFGAYSNPDGDTFLDFGNTGGEVNGLNLTAGVSYGVQLRWEDSWGGASTDLDLLLYDRIAEEFIEPPSVQHPITGRPGHLGTDPQSGGPGHIPLEYISFVSSVDSVRYGFVVGHYSGPAPEWIQLLAFGSGKLDHRTYEGSITNPSESANPGLLAVGAAPWFDTQTIAEYSGAGPTPDGRVKPDIVGADCGATSISPLEFSSQLGGDCGFAGTSQAAPHVAGLAALVKQANPSFTPQQVADYLKNSAAEREEPGPDNDWGYGFAQLGAPPVRTIPDAPTITSITSGNTTLSVIWAAPANNGGAEITDYDLRYIATGDDETVDANWSLVNSAWTTGGGGLEYTITELSNDTQYDVQARAVNSVGHSDWSATITGTPLVTTPTPPSDSCGEALTGDGVSSGEWAEGCPSAVADRGYARYYGFTLEDSSEVTITLESTAADTYLYLREGEARSGDSLYDNDDHEGSMEKSQIQQTLAAGSYTIEATTYDPDETGSFTLTISGLGATAGPSPGPSDSCGEALTGDGVSSGEWAEGCPSAVADRGYARYYGFTLEDSSEVTITLESTAADTYLYLREGEARSGDSLYDNDDHEGSMEKSQIQQTLAAGSYTIEATTYDPDETGSFTLTISGLGATAGPSPGPSDSCGEALTGDGVSSGEWAEGCPSAVADRGYARYYGFTLEDSSEVTITLESTAADTYLYLREGEARSGDSLYDNDDHEGSMEKSQIQQTLAAGSYTIEATTYDPDETGSFTLTISGLGATAGPSPGPSDSCGEALTGDGVSSGEWAEGCPSAVADRGYARYYGFTLEDSSEVTITLESTAADTYLYLREGEARSGDSLYDNDDHEGSMEKSQIQQTLAAGSYTIEATTYDPDETGSFTLTISGLGATAGPSPGPSDSCGEALTGDGVSSGEWAEGCPSAVADRGYARYYGFTLEDSSEVTITLESTAADTYLYLREGEARSGDSLYDNDDHEGSMEKSQIQQTLAAGSYTIEATTYDPDETGSFTLTISGLGATAGPSPGPSDSCGEALTGDGVSSGEWAEGCPSAVADRGYARYYGFTLEDSSEVTITLESTAADTYLYLREGEARSGDSLYDNDDHEGSMEKSQIQQTLAAGSYTIEATTYDPDETGSFTLTISGLGATAGPSPGPSDSCGEALTGDGVSSGEWAEGCPSAVADRGYARYYGFTLEDSSEVTITLESTAADTYLYLREGEARSGDSLYDNDDHEGSMEKSQIQQTLAAGSYTIEATTYDPDETGSFTLTISGLGATAGPSPGPSDSCGEALTGDGVSSGEWAEGCPSAVADRGYARYYGFTLTQQSAVTITLQSTDANTYLYLRSGESQSGAFLHENDDDGGTTRSKIEMTLSAGTYTIEATTFRAGETGSFALSISGLGGTARLFNAVSAGEKHTCGVRSDGSITCWGDNEVGQASSPAGSFVSVSAGRFHSCGVRSDGSVACWGDDRYGRATPPAGSFVSVSAGWLHTCGLRSGGSVACWGSDSYGLDSPPTGSFISVSAGSDHACGVRSGGSVTCWGGNEFGQATPPAGSFVSVTAGFLHNCALRSDGSVACWGSDSHGQSTPPAGSFISVSAGGAHICGVRGDGAVACWGGNQFGRATPPAGSFISVSAGWLHACGVRSDGSVACWGNNEVGQVTPPAGSFVSVSAGFLHNCALRSDGSVACWGDDSHGRATPPAGSFVSVSAGWLHTCGLRSDGSAACWGSDSYGLDSPPTGSFISVSAGWLHTCGLRSSGSVACWGGNENGQATPPAGSFISVSAGWLHTCGVRSDGSAACWGSNENGQAASPAGSFVSVSAREYHTCGVRSDGSVACWGRDEYGQATPPTGSFVSVSAGWFHTCGLRSDGSVACWGSDSHGQATPPTGSFVSVSAGEYHTCGVRSDGSVACWGRQTRGLNASDFPQ